MSNIDPDKLEEALTIGREIANQDEGAHRWRTITGEFLNRLCDAAEAHLATLPRMKEVEVERWGIVYPSGYTGSLIYDSEEEARRTHTGGLGVPIRLTGTAKVPA